MEILVSGLITGAVFAIAASGLVVTYSTSGVFNFAHGALGMLCAYVYWDLRVNDHHTWPLLPKGRWPAPLALVAVLGVFAPLLGAVIHRFVVRGLRDTPELVKLVVPISMLLASIALAGAVLNVVFVRLLQGSLSGAAHRLQMEQSRLFSTSVVGLQSIETLKATGGENDFFSRWAGYHARSVNSEQKLAIYQQAIDLLPPILLSLTSAAGKERTSVVGVRTEVDESHRRVALR